MRFTIEQYGWFKEVLKCMTNFEPVCTNLISADNGDTNVIMERFSAGVMALSVFDEDDDEIFTASMWFNEAVDNSNGHLTYIGKHLSVLDYCAPFPNRVFINKDRFSHNPLQIKLDYPLHDDQYFQKLTITNLPSEDDINRFISISSEILPDADKFHTLTFRGRVGMDKINETNQENVVQSVMVAMERLVQIEKQRVEQDGFLDDFFEP